METLGEFIRRRRKELKITLSKFAEMLGVSMAYVSEIERNSLFTDMDWEVALEKLMSFDHILCISKWREYSKLKLECGHCPRVIHAKEIKPDEAGVFIFHCDCGNCDCGNVETTFNIPELIAKQKADSICRRIFGCFGVDETPYSGNVLKADDNSLEMEVVLDNDDDFGDSVKKDFVIVKIEIIR